MLLFFAYFNNVIYLKNYSDPFYEIKSKQIDMKFFNMFQITSKQVKKSV